MSSFINSNNYSDQLEAYRQSYNICAFLNVSIGLIIPAQIELEKTLKEKFAALDAAGFHLSSSPILDFFIPSILRQFTVSRCAYERQLTIKSKSDQNGFAFIVAIGNEFPGMLASQIIVPSSVAMLSVLFNISLLIVTARKISMSTVCNWLIAFDSFCQIPAMFPFLVNLFAVCAHFNQVDPSVCLAFLMLSTGSSYASFLAVFFMSLERLLIVMMPMRMSQLSEKTIKHCSWLALLACTCFGVVMVLNIFNISTDINSAFGTSRLYCNNWFFSYAMSAYYVSHKILGLTLFNYVFIASMIVWRRIYVPSTQADSINNAARSQATYRMLRSVFLISLILLIGWIFGSVMFEQFSHHLIFKLTQAVHAFVKSNFAKSKEGAWFASNLDKWLLGMEFCLFPMAAGLNAPVLIINNSDYRTAYRKMLAPLLVCRRKRNSVAVGPLFNNHHFINKFSKILKILTKILFQWGSTFTFFLPRQMPLLGV